MGPGSLAVIGAVVVPLLGVSIFAGFGLMCFPSIRSAVVERFRQRALRHADAADIVAQIAALRGEVYALRSELARATGALPSVGGEAQMSSGSPQRRIMS
jgi:uncharacterized protein YqgC (DUF456 family)